MKWRLEEDHYDSDAMVLLPAGTIVGDGCANDWHYPLTSANRALAGKARPPSRAMVPADDEAKKFYHEKFGGEPPERDPTKAIPLTGVPRDPAGNVVQANPPHPSSPDIRPRAEVAKTVSNK